MRQFLMIIGLFFVVNLSSQVTSVTVYRDLVASIQEKGDSIILDYDLTYECFSSKNIVNEKESVIKGCALFLFNHPNWCFEIGMYLDCRGNSVYNLLLSQRLADLFKNDLLKKGVSRFQVLSNGYGGEYPLNDCDCNILCSENKFKENRRYVLKLKSKNEISK